VDTPSFADIEANAQDIVDAIGRESVEVYRYLMTTYERGPISKDYLFQFTYRHFYRMERAGLTHEFGRQYFEALDTARGRPELDLRDITGRLYGITRVRGDPSVQFSFVTKLAHTAQRECPIYDRVIGAVFGFVPPDGSPPQEQLDKYLRFHDCLKSFYGEVRSRNRLAEARARFRTQYQASPEAVSEIKVLDFIFWTAGKVLRAGDGERGSVSEAISDAPEEQ
jgi:hypothetical protein